MSGVHDLGGLDGFGAVEVEEDYVAFHHEWEASSQAIMMETTYDWPLDWARRVRELCPQDEYMGTPYFANWALVHAALLAGEGIITPEQLDTGQADDPATPVRRDVSAAVAMDREMMQCFDRPATAGPLFRPGQSVRTLAHGGPGHTRLPRYARDAVGRVRTHHGAFVLPDDMARGTERAVHLYTVAFSSDALFARDTGPGHTVCLDLWETYLRAAGGADGPA
ncbi:nitrile hydratase subunit beta [Roseovarius salis]|uniref:nitrile hydratase subunit beta n=1 Tax=Roseovarius salis TaxID=3376063 RepID=UPI0037C60830